MSCTVWKKGRIKVFTGTYRECEEHMNFRGYDLNRYAIKFDPTPKVVIDPETIPDPAEDEPEEKIEDVSEFGETLAEVQGVEPGMFGMLPPIDSNPTVEPSYHHYLRPISDHLD